jgi:hypothetical protein
VEVARRDQVEPVDAAQLRELGRRDLDAAVQPELSHSQISSSGS